MKICEDWPCLSEDEAQQLISQGKNNEYTVAGTKSRKSIWLTNLFTFYNVLNVFLAVLIATTKSYRNMFFMVIVAANFLIGTIQELRAKKALDSLSVLTSPKLRVIRDGKIKTVSSRNIVTGDLIVLGSGDQVMADGEIYEGEIRLNESLITGESDPVIKSKGESIKSGSYVLSGEAAVRITAVGKESFAEKIVSEGRKEKHSGSVLKEIMKKIIKVISFFIIPMGILSFISHYFWQNLGYRESMISVVASMVGMIPDGLYLLTSISFAAGVIRLSKRKTLVQQLYSLESLARVDVLCLDKTGTITTGKMKVSGEIKLCDCDIGEILSKLYSVVPVDNETARAVVSEYGQKNSTGSALHILPFSSENKFVAADFGNGECWIFGAPEYVLKNVFEKELDKAAELERNGVRVLVLATAEREDKEYSAYKILGFIQIEDEIRENAAETFAFFGKNDVTLKVISGDSAETVSVISQKAGIPNADRYLDVSDLSDDEIAEKADGVTVFGRVRPDQKRIIVKALKNLGHKVAMTGDGVNDVPALKEADCSVAMANGSSAASSASQIVLVDSDFSAMPDVVYEGRRVINNIQRAAPLFLMKTMYSFLITLTALFLGTGYPFEPIQLTFIGLIASAIPGLMLSFEPSFERVKDGFIKTVLMRAAAGAVSIFTGLMIILISGQRFGFSGEEIASMALIFTGFSSLVTLAITCIPVNLYKAVALSLSAVAFAAGILLFRDIFMVVALSKAQYIIIFILCALTPIQYFFGRGRIWKKTEK